MSALSDANHVPRAAAARYDGKSLISLGLSRAAGIARGWNPHPVLGNWGHVPAGLPSRPPR
jgi:hypothetical protein